MSSLIPSELKEEIEAENSEWDVLAQCYQIHHSMVELTGIHRSSIASRVGLGWVGLGWVIHHSMAEIAGSGRSSIASRVGLGWVG